MTDSTDNLGLLAKSRLTSGSDLLDVLPKELFVAYFGPVFTELSATCRTWHAWIRDGSRLAADPRWMRPDSFCRALHRRARWSVAWLLRYGPPIEPHIYQLCELDPALVALHLPRIDLHEASTEEVWAYALRHDAALYNRLLDDPTWSLGKTALAAHLERGEREQFDRLLLNPRFNPLRKAGSLVQWLFRHERALLRALICHERVPADFGHNYLLGETIRAQDTDFFDFLWPRVNFMLGDAAFVGHCGSYNLAVFAAERPVLIPIVEPILARRGDWNAYVKLIALLPIREAATKLLVVPEGVQTEETTTRNLLARILELPRDDLPAGHERLHRWYHSFDASDNRVIRLTHAEPYIMRRESEEDQIWRGVRHRMVMQMMLAFLIGFGIAAWLTGCSVPE